MRVFRLAALSEEEIASGVPLYLVFTRMEKYREQIETYFGDKMEELDGINADELYMVCNGLSSEDLELVPFDQIGKWLTEELGV